MKRRFNINFDEAVSFIENRFDVVGVDHILEDLICRYEKGELEPEHDFRPDDDDRGRLTFTDLLEEGCIEEIKEE